MRSPSGHDVTDTRDPPAGSSAPAQVPRADSPLQAEPPPAAQHAVVVAVALSALGLFDAWLGARGGYSLGLTGGEAALLPFWVRGRLGPSSTAGADRAGSRGRGVLAVVALTAVLCLGVKAWIGWSSIADPVGLSPSYRTFTVGLVSVVLLCTIVPPHSIERFLVRVSERPARLMALSFGLTALAGAFLLSVPAAFRSRETTSFLDALFTSVSAVCLTGLSVLDVSSTYSRFGQVVLLGLIQIGGFGIMVLSAFFAVVAGRKFSARGAAVIAEMVDAESMASFRRHIAAIVLFTFVYEALGTLALFGALRLQPEVAFGAMPGVTASDSDLLWAAAFHAVSAFCNAGFSVFQDGAAPFVQSWMVCSTLMALVVLGGLGFPVHSELLGRTMAALRRQPRRRLSLHARVVLSVSAILLVAGALVFALLEWSQSMAGLPWHARVLAALFHSTSTRTAGFNTVDVGAMAPATLVLTGLWMFVGGSPGSTAGGIKTSTLAALFAYFRAELRGSGQATLFDRALPETTLRRAVGVTSLSMALAIGVVVLLCIVEQHAPLALIFEALSAFATVGLSTGITAELSPAGKGLVIGAMFVGRIGPLTLAFLFTERASRLHYRRPEERIAIG
jgi:trk system potassium uptake protein